MPSEETAMPRGSWNHDWRPSEWSKWPDFSNLPAIWSRSTGSFEPPPHAQQSVPALKLAVFSLPHLSELVLYQSQYCPFAPACVVQ